MVIEHRRDIQGLRAIAVMAVVLDHTLGSPVGGYLGVDVFFVVSGFLITGLLLREEAKTGRISLVRFWVRRCLRLAPAFVVVTAAALALDATLVPGRLGTDGPAALAGAVSMANWYAVVKQFDYFAADGPASIFDHYWSLAVEEQFYLVWPAVVVAVLWLSRRRLRRRGYRRARNVLVGFLVVAVTGSLSYAFVSTGSAPTTAYYSTGTRVWEVGAGAILALLVPSLALPRSLGRVLSWTGIALVTLSVLTIPPAVGAPAPAAIGAVAGTAMVLVGGADARARPFAISNPVTDWFGSISYSLYLWHLPLIVIARIVVPGAAWVAILLAVLLAYGTLVLVEDPVRRRSRAPRSPARAVRVRGNVLAVGAVSTAVAISVAVVAIKPEPVVPALPAPVAPTVPVSAVQDRLGTALERRAWPAGSTIVVDSSTVSAARCGDRDTATRPSIEECTFGPRDAAHTAVLLGDSMAGVWIDSLLPWLRTEHPDWRIIALPVNGCPLIELDLASVLDGCDELERRNRAILAQVRPEVTFVSTRIEGGFLLGGGRRATSEEVRDGLGRAFDLIRPHTGQLVHILPAPYASDLRECASPLGSPVSCVATVSTEWSENASIVGELAAGDSAVIDTRPLVARGDLSPALIDDQPMRRDHAHLTADVAASLSAALGSLIDRAGVLTDREDVRSR